MDTKTVKVDLKYLEHGTGLPIPRYMTAGASGMDIYAALDGKIRVKPGSVTLVPTGLTVAVPEGFELQIRPRSGLAAKNGIGLLNSPGTIDSDYRGEIKVILINLSPKPFEIERGDRIAQMVLCPVMRIAFNKVDSLPPTERSDGGFGHTGL